MASLKKKTISFVAGRSVREQADRLFSRDVLGSVFIGKFIGDYSAIWAQRLLGTDVGYTTGIFLAFLIFIYWERIERAAEGGKEKAEETKEKVSKKTGREKENKYV